MDFFQRRYTTPFAIIRDVMFVAFALTMLTWLWPFHSVPTGYRGVVTQFGKIIGVENEGLVVLPPWQKLAIFNIRSEEAHIKNAEGATSDTQAVAVSMTVRYSIAVDKVAEVYEKYSHDGNMDSYVQTATAEIFKAVTAKYTAPDLIAKRPNVSGDIGTALRQKVATYGVQIINIDMTNFAFAKSYTDAINEKVTQEQKKLAADNKLKTVESEQKQKVAIAEAEATAMKAEADGKAYYNVTMAKATAESLRIQANAIASNPQVLELERIKVEMEKASKWNGALPTSIYSGAPIPFLQVK